MAHGKPPPLGAVLETSLYVDDLERARNFYEDLLGLTPIVSDGRMVAFGVGGRSVLLLFLRGTANQTIELPGGTIPPHDGAGPLHIAFAVTPAERASWEAHLAAAGIPIEGRTEWNGRGESIYFRDPDGHLLELAPPEIWGPISAR